jgi:hypothetical protein
MELLTLTSPALWPYSFAIILLLGLLALELIGLLLSSSPFTLIDNLIPQIPDGPLEWLHLGRVPALVLILLFLLGFSLTGYALQAACWHALGLFLSHLWVMPLATVGGLLLMRTLGLTLGTWVPQDQSYAVSELALIGRMATMSGGTAKKGIPAQGRVRDQHGRLHYVQIEPEDGELPLGSDVMLTHKMGVCYRARLLLPVTPSHDTH